MKTKMFLATVTIVVLIVFFSVPCFSQAINGCYHNKNGKLRIVANHSQCKTKELPISWNVSSGPSFGWALTGNSGTNPSNNFLGTLDNNELRFRVNDTVGFRIVPTSGSPNIIGGSISNSFFDGVMGGVIGGGGNADHPNTVNDCYSTIGGGAGNVVGLGPACDGYSYSTVGGGYGNTAGSFYSTVGGGWGNSAVEAGTVAGGYYNRAYETATVEG